LSTRLHEIGELTRAPWWRTPESVIHTFPHLMHGSYSSRLENST